MSCSEDHSCTNVNVLAVSRKEVVRRGYVVGGVSLACNCTQEGLNSKKLGLPLKR